MAGTTGQRVGRPQTIRAQPLIEADESLLMLVITFQEIQPITSLIPRTGLFSRHGPSVPDRPCGLFDLIDTSSVKLVDTLGCRPARHGTTRPPDKPFGPSPTQPDSPRGVAPCVGRSSRTGCPSCSGERARPPNPGGSKPERTPMRNLAAGQFAPLALVRDAGPQVPQKVR